MCPDGYWGVFYETPGTGMATGEKRFYGKSFFATEEQAIKSQKEWEARHA